MLSASSFVTSTVIISSCKFANITRSASGAALSATGDRMTLTVSNSIFQSNTASASGGAADLSLLSATFFSCQFLNNAANGGDGGSLRLQSNSVLPSLTISNTTFTKNTASSSGGAIACLTFTTVSLSSVNCSCNQADLGGCLFLQLVHVQLNNVTFMNNIARSVSAVSSAALTGCSNTTVPVLASSSFGYSGSGGAITLFFATVTMQACVFVNNAATSAGGAISTFSTTLITSRTDAQGNEASVGGFLFTSFRSVVQIDANSSFAAHRACSGGVLFAQGATSVSVAATSFTDNHALQYGGVLLVDQTLVSFSDTDFSANAASAGGVYFMLPSTAPPTFDGACVFDPVNVNTAGQGPISASTASSMVLRNSAQLVATLQSPNHVLSPAPVVELRDQFNQTFSALLVDPVTVFSAGVAGSTREFVSAGFATFASLTVASAVPFRLTFSYGALSPVSVELNVTTLCATGEYFSFPSCLPCEVGKFSASASVVLECSLCAAGKFANATRASSCDACPLGTYSSAGMSTCSDWY